MVEEQDDHCTSAPAVQLPLTFADAYRALGVRPRPLSLLSASDCFIGAPIMTKVRTPI